MTIILSVIFGFQWCDDCGSASSYLVNKKTADNRQ